jgi:polyhydroxyalkanoate synthesis regulator phasin
MPKKKDEISQTEQSERFRRAVKDMVDAGELSLTEADERFEEAMGRIASNRCRPSG